MPSYARSPVILCCLVASLLMLAACADGPTSPKVFTHPADGEIWAAIVVPEGTPDARTWLPYVRDGRTDSSPVIREIRQYQAEAERLRRSGDLIAAQAREEDAALLAARSISQAPPAHVLVTAISALDIWSERARSASINGEFPEIAATLREVDRVRRSARSALAAGDTTVTLEQVTEAAGRIREQSPAVVASRVLVRAEARMQDLTETDPEAARAVRLLRYSREALANGDPVRALRRALYALQLADQIAPPEPTVQTAAPTN